MRASGTVTARQKIADIAIVVLPVGQTMKDVAFVQNLWPTICEVSAPRCLYGKHGPNLGREHAKSVSYCLQTIAR